MPNVEEALLVAENEERPTTWCLFVEEVKKTSYLAIPMMVVTISQQLSRVVSTMMVGHLGELALSASAIATSLTNVLGFSVLWGMSSALETLCGQAYGAKQYHKLGIYTYGAIISLLGVCIPISILWMFLDKLLIFSGQDPMISQEAGRYAVWLIPTLFPYAILQALIRYLQTQSLIVAMVLSSIAALLFQIPICWVFVFKLDLGIAGAALSIGLSYWLNVILLAVYVKYSSACEETRLSFSGDVLPSIIEFFRFAVPATIMVCLEWWTFEIIILLAGLLPKPQLESSVLSICLLVSTMHYFIPFSIGAAASTRVSNELGAENPDAARMAVKTIVVLAIVEVIVVTTTFLSIRHILGYAFSNEKEVAEYVKDMIPFVCLLLVSDCFQAVLSGVARGSGWQHICAYINLGAFYLVGIPVAIVLGFVLHLRGKGLWIGLTSGSAVQSTLLVLITSFTNWEKQAYIAKQRIFYGSISQE